eukprot:RCo046998
MKWDRGRGQKAPRARQQRSGGGGQLRKRENGKETVGRRDGGFHSAPSPSLLWIKLPWGWDGGSQKYTRNPRNPARNTRSTDATTSQSRVQSDHPRLVEGRRGTSPPQSRSLFLPPKGGGRQRAYKHPPQTTELNANTKRMTNSHSGLHSRNPERRLYRRRQKEGVANTATPQMPSAPPQLNNKPAHTPHTRKERERKSKQRMPVRAILTHRTEFSFPSQNKAPLGRTRLITRTHTLHPTCRVVLALSLLVFFRGRRAPSVFLCVAPEGRSCLFELYKSLMPPRFTPDQKQSRATLTEQYVCVCVRVQSLFGGGVSVWCAC